MLTMIIDFHSLIIRKDQVLNLILIILSSSGIALFSGKAIAYDYYRYNSPLDDFNQLMRKQEQRQAEKVEIDNMQKIVLSKFSNGATLIKKGDRVGGCRDMGIAISLFDKLKYRQDLYYSSLSSADAELKKAELDIARKQLGNVMKSTFGSSCE